MTSKQRATLYLELSKLLASGLHADRSVDLLLEQRPPSHIKKFLQGLQKGLQQKMGFTESITKHNRESVTSLETTLLAAGERGGRLEHSCQHLGHYFTLRHKSIDKIIAALIYPLVILHIGFFLPEIVSFFSGTPIQSILYKLVSRLLVLWSLLVVLTLIGLQFSKASANSILIDNFLRKLPLIGSVSRHWALARFCQVFQTGLLAALNISETLKLSGEASQSATIQKGSHKAAKLILQSQSLADALKASAAFPKSFVNAIHTAEVTGTLDIEMARWAQIESELAARQQDQAAEWLPRIFYFLVIIYIASHIYNFMRALYGEGSQINELLNTF